MPTGITVTMGHAPIPFAGMGGRVAARGRRGGRRGFGSFGASPDLINIAWQALARYRNAIDVANEKCAERSGWLQSGLDWASDTSASMTTSICNAAAQMQTNYSFYQERIQDYWISDEQVTEIIGFINREVDIRDLVDLARTT